MHNQIGCAIIHQQYTTQYNGMTGTYFCKTINFTTNLIWLVINIYSHFLVISFLRIMSRKLCAIFTLLIFIIHKSF